MPTAQSSQPKCLRPYLFHGIDLTWKGGDKEAVGECPFCSREDKFNVEVETGQWKCWVCQEKGNITVFLQKLWAVSDEATQDYSILLDSRGLEHPDTLMAWGACRSVTTGDWILPGYEITGKLTQLYRYVAGTDRTRLLPTPTIKHRLFGTGLYDKDKPLVFLCEGPWDAMVLWELLRQAKEVEGSLKPTASRSNSVLAKANVLGVPGCTIFEKLWCSLFSNKTVTLLYDNDHPLEHSTVGKVPAPAGFAGMKRVAGILANNEEPPLEVNFLAWGERGFDPSLPSGYDLRDCVKLHKEPNDVE